MSPCTCGECPACDPIDKYDCARAKVIDEAYAECEDRQWSRVRWQETDAWLSAPCQDCHLPHRDCDCLPF